MEILEIDKEIDSLKRRVSELEKQKQLINWQNIKSFEDACYHNNESPTTKIDNWKYANLSSQQINQLMLEYCIDTINGNWKINWKDSSQPKYYIWWKHTAHGWVVFVVNCDFYDSSLSFGCYYENEAKANHGAKYFKQYYNLPE